MFSEQEEGERNWLMPPTIDVTFQKFLMAVTEVERFAEWLERP